MSMVACEEQGAECCAMAVPLFPGKESGVKADSGCVCPVHGKEHFATQRIGTAMYSAVLWSTWTFIEEERVRLQLADTSM